MSIRLGIDGSNLRSGGAVTHLVELLRAAEPGAAGISAVTVWGEPALLECLPDRPWLRRARVERLAATLPARLLWQTTQLDAVARGACDVLYVPSGFYLGRFRPFVTMSRNMLPFDPDNAARYREDRMRLRLWLLRRVQTQAFRRADGLIFLTHTAQRIVSAAIGAPRGRTAVIPHGVNDVFRLPPRPQRGLDEYSAERPFEWLYVSIIDVYKHQDVLVQAVARLRERHVPAILRLVGPAYGPALQRLRETLAQHDPRGEFVHYDGAMSHEALPAVYHAADGYVFASTCENLPNTLLEGMAAGLPIACARAGVMPEVLQDGGAYFDSLDPEHVADTLHNLMKNPALRTRLVQQAYARAQQFSWSASASKTLQFTAACARKVAA